MENVSLHLTQDEVDHLLDVLKTNLRENNSDNYLNYIVNNIEFQISM
jgi:hypothetical protein